MTSANERWTQRIMGGLGVRPVGHSDPRDRDPDDGPQVPAPAPPPAPPAAGPEPQQRVPDWWRVERPPLEDLHPAPPAAAPAAPVAAPPAQRAAPPAPQQPAPSGPVAKTPQPGGPVKKVASDQKRTAVRKLGEGVTGDRRVRIVAFNGSAACFGWGLGLVDLLKPFIAASEQAAVGVFGLVLAVVCAGLAWKATGSPVFAGVFKGLTPVLRPIVTALAAEIGRRNAPVAVAYVNAYGEEWGLGPSAVSLLLTAAGICGALWWCIDRRIRHWHWSCRWLLRVPLASALLTVLPYSSGPVA
ncbi:hypothetical protein ACPCSG_23770 [Streptomyces cellulosae]